MSMEQSMSEASLTVKWVSPLFGGYAGTRSASDTALYGKVRPCCVRSAK